MTGRWQAQSLKREELRSPNQCVNRGGSQKRVLMRKLLSGAKQNEKVGETILTQITVQECRPVNRLKGFYFYFFFVRSVSVASTFKVWLDQVAGGLRSKPHEKGRFLRLKGVKSKASYIDLNKLFMCFHTCQFHMHHVEKVKLNFFPMSRFCQI